MGLGHGTPGTRSKLRTFLDLYDASSRGSITMLDVQAGYRVDPASWTVHSGSVYKQALAVSLGGHVRPVVEVRSSIAPYVLTRVEAIADVAAGCWFWDGAAAIPELYLRLPDSSDPENATVLAMLLFGFATRGVVHPILGPNLLADGDVENWTTSIDLASWNENITGTGWAVFRDDALAPTGRYAVRISGVDTTSGRFRLAQTPAGNRVVGAMYRASGIYRTSEDFSPGLEARLEIGTGAGGFINEDGRSLGGTDPTLLPTQGETRRYQCDFVAHIADPLYRPALTWLSGTASGTLWLDGMALQRIYGWVYYEPRLSADAIPQVEMAGARRGFGGSTASVGEARIINQDGLYEGIFGQLEMHGRSALVRVGGEFPDGQTIGIEDCRVSYPGIIQDVDGDDRYIALRLEAASVLKKKLPLNLYGLAGNPDMDLNREGYARPLMFGQGNHGGPAIRYVNPTRIAVDATTQYGEYEVLDASDSPAGVEAMTVHTFLTAEDRDGVK